MKRRKSSPLIHIRIAIHRWEVLLFISFVLLTGITWHFYCNRCANSDIDIVDALGGNIFPSQILSTAVTDDNILLPIDTPYVGKSANPIAIRIRSRKKNTRVRIELSESPFFSYSASEFVLPKPGTDYIIYPEIAWNYEALRQNEQATPINILVQAYINNQAQPQVLRTFSMRSINECLLGYYTSIKKNSKRFRSTRKLFAAYVNEDNPQIDRILREALNSRLVNRFIGYQGDSASVVKQVYALWNVMQQRNLKYSSISTSSLSSNVLYSQRVRTFDDVLNHNQINCVDGSVLFASLLRAINIIPVLVRLPNHMFVGFYTDKQRKNLQFLEVTMIGDVNLDDYFPEDKLDSTLQQVSRNRASEITFEKAREYANKNYLKNKKQLTQQSPGYMFLAITPEIRRRIQPIGK